VKALGTILDHPCPECGAAMTLRKSRYGLFYGCTRYPECKAAHSAHAATGEPLGTPADAGTKQWRIRAHAAFDTLWRGPGAFMSRPVAYRWMWETLGLARDGAHIGLFDQAQCERLIEAVAAYRGKEHKS